MSSWLVRQWRSLVGGDRGVLLNLRDVTSQMQWHALRAEELQGVVISIMKMCEAHAVVWRECQALATEKGNATAQRVAEEQLVLLEHTGASAARAAMDGADSVEHINADQRQMLQAFRNLRAQFEYRGAFVTDIVVPNAETERARARASIQSEWEAELLPPERAQELMRAMA